MIPTEPLKPSAEDAIRRVDDIMVDVFEVERESLRRDAQLADDLDLDSLDGVDLVIAIEKTFGYKLAEEEARNIKTLGDIYDRVLARVAGAETA
jgi:acyl carrier protein